MASAIKDENGKTLMNKSDIVKRWTRYCSSLYQTNMDQDLKAQVIEESQEISSPNEKKEETKDYILETEVRRTIQRLKNNKGTGYDEVVAEMLKHGGEHVFKEIHKICNAAWKEGQTPEEGEKTNSSHCTQKGKFSSLQQLQNRLIDKYREQSNDNDINRETKTSARRKNFR